MKRITREWVDKAEGDFATAQRELIVHPDPNYDAVCFHSQQCTEKFLKARLQEAREALEACRRVRWVVRTALGLDEDQSKISE